MNRVERFVAALQKKAPDFKIAFKNESWLMKILGYILFFNPRFMTGFVTTVGSTIYYPNRLEFIQKSENSSPALIAVLAHEFVHVHDRKEMGTIPFIFYYMFPQLLAPFMLLLAFISWPLALILFILFLAPLPSPGRKTLELKAYFISLFVANELMKEINISESGRLYKLQEMLPRMNYHFTSFEYYLMWPFGVKQEVEAAIKAIISEEIANSDVIYSQVVSALHESK